jgi:hypothetical protein
MGMQRQTLSDLRWMRVFFCIQVCGEANGWLRSPLTDEETAMIETRDVTGIGIHGTNFCLDEDYRS